MPALASARKRGGEIATPCVAQFATCRPLGRRLAVSRYQHQQHIPGSAPPTGAARGIPVPFLRTDVLRCLARPADLESQTVTGPWQGRSNTCAAIGGRARADGCQIVQGSAILIFTPMRTGVVHFRHLPQQMSGQPTPPFFRTFRAHAADYG